MTTYNQDIVAWAQEQAGFIRAGRFDMLDIEHIAGRVRRGFGPCYGGWNRALLAWDRLNPTITLYINKGVAWNT